MESNIKFDIITSIVSEIMNIKTIPNSDSNLIELGLDSIMTIQLIVRLEMDLGVVFKDEDLLIENFTSIRNIYNLIKLRGSLTTIEEESIGEG
ncbi:acyl carrier protein [Paenibacillus lautus]|uniref:acyl carrier protein n=1 Tax=Paenibacillus lautus TaxID=1401 RepID=UPI003D2D0271